LLSLPRVSRSTMSNSRPVHPSSRAWKNRAR
jgi:hypothetical protein